jgi:hypothetical protein
VALVGILLTFMFLLDMVGALVLIPALSHFLLGKRREPMPETEAATGALAEQV